MKFAPKNLLKYAEGVLGFPVHEWMEVVTTIPYQGSIGSTDHTAPAGAVAKILSIDWFDEGHGLSISLVVDVPGVLDDEGDQATITQTFDERDAPADWYAFTIPDLDRKKRFRVSLRGIVHVTQEITYFAENEEAARNGALARAATEPFDFWDESDPEDLEIEMIEEVV